MIHTQLPDTAYIFDTTFFTFRGIKAMGRITFNPGALIQSDLLGPNDFKLYIEMGILGFKNYWPWYSDILDRIPIMFGFNLPTFKLLDVMSLQLQYFRSPYWNTWEFMWKSGSALPYQGSLTPSTYEGWIKDTSASTAPIHEDDWKWSLYMSRKVGKNMRFSLQFANDNLFKTKYMPPPPTQSKFVEITRSTWWKGKWGMIDNWYWMAKIMYYF